MSAAKYSLSFPFTGKLHLYYELETFFTPFLILIYILNFKLISQQLAVSHFTYIKPDQNTNSTSTSNQTLYSNFELK